LPVDIFVQQTAFRIKCQKGVFFIQKILRKNNLLVLIFIYFSNVELLENMCGNSASTESVRVNKKREFNTFVTANIPPGSSSRYFILEFIFFSLFRC
jgi:hypothetical protein